MMLNSFHVPLIDYNDYSLSLCLINLFEEILISLINEYSLELREEYISGLNIPIHCFGIQAFLSECYRASRC